MARLTDQLAAQHLIGDLCPVCEEAAATVVVELSVPTEGTLNVRRVVVCRPCATTIGEQFDYVTRSSDAKAH